MKKVVHTESAPKAVGPYSQAIECKGFLFTSGQIPINPKSGTVDAIDVAEQTDQVLKNLQAVLEKAGYSLENVVKTTCLLSDIADFKAMNEIYAVYFPTDPPARSTFAVKDLPMGVLVEIEAIAAK